MSSRLRPSALSQNTKAPAGVAAIIAGTTLERLGETGEIASAVLWLCEGAGYLTGQAIAVDGGWTSR